MIRPPERAHSPVILARANSDTVLLPLAVLQALQEGTQFFFELTPPRAIGTT